MGILYVYVEDALAEESVLTSVDLFEKECSVKGLSFPGRYMLKVEIIDETVRYDLLLLISCLDNLFTMPESL